MRKFSAMLVSLAFLLAAFLPNAGWAAQKGIVVGFTMSQTGKFNSESKEQYEGLKLWLSQVNANGGIYVKSMGEKLPVTFKYYDDESSKDRVQQLYVRIINNDKADFLISPYSSGLTASSAIIAEQYGKVMMATGAASDSIFNKGYTQVYQIYTPASRYLTGSLDILASRDPKAKKVAIVFENSKFAKSVCTAAKKYAEEKGFNVVMFEAYDSGTTDFTSFINKIKATNPNAIIGGGHFADGETFCKQLFEQKVKVKLVSLLVAPAIPEFSELGKAALYVTGPSQWEPLARFSKKSAKSTWFGPTSVEFTKAFQKAFGHVPGYHAAGGYIAGLVLQKAIEDAGTIKSKNVRKALEKMDITTFYGRIKFDTGKFYGRQIGHSMVYLQWQKKQGKMVKEVVWPLEAKSADLVYPFYNKY